MPPNSSADAGLPTPLIPSTVRIPGVPAFLLGRTAVTNREYGRFLEASGAPAPPWWGREDFRSPDAPVVGVTWADAVEFCGWLSRMSGRCWRLPTEAEWEFAACGGLIAPRTAWGDAIPPGEIPEGPLAGPWETGRGTPNGYGLCDAGTIVHEWCENWRLPDPPSPAPRRRASRGGSWRHRVRWSAPSAASSLPPEYRYSDYGFRVRCQIGVDSPVGG